MKRTVFVVLTAAATLVAAFAAPDRGAGGNLFTLCLTATSSVGPHDLASAWSLAPAVIIPLLALGVAYAGRAPTHLADKWRTVCFLIGYLALSAAVLSPLCRMAATLAWAHMIQHVVLVAIAPPLILLGFDHGRAGGSMISDSDVAWRRLMAHPGWTAVPYGMLIWFWHVPRLYEASLTDVSVHLMMYASLLGAAFLFWNSVIVALRSQPVSRAWALAALTVTLAHTSALGALLTFARHLWFPIMAPGALVWGLTPLDDQQLAGLIMWVPMGIAYLAAALWAFGIVLADTNATAAAGR